MSVLCVESEDENETQAPQSWSASASSTNPLANNVAPAPKIAGSFNGILPPPHTHPSTRALVAKPRKPSAAKNENAMSVSKLTVGANRGSENKTRRSVVAPPFLFLLTPYAVERASRFAPPPPS
jgi:hypothetical protein